MAITPTGDIFKGFEFDGLSSKNYGIYITGNAVYNAPERDVEMLTIPGRNGMFALDQGRFENIEVTYPAGIFADNELDFAVAISDFRNYLCSRNGYCRLTDEYNPTEYRMAVYKSGLEVNPAQLKAGQFNITFECKPQRFLTSGETAVTITSGSDIANPTLFKSSPMLEVTGYGAINIGGETVTVNNSVLGEIGLCAPLTVENTSLQNGLVTTNLNTGDSIYKKKEQSPYVRLNMRVIDSSRKIVSVDIGTPTNGTYSYNHISEAQRELVVYPTIPTYSFGTAQQITTTVPLIITLNGSDIYNCTLTVKTTYSGNSISITASRGSGWPATSIMRYTTTCSCPAFYGDSTKSLLPTPMYIDLDIGEAYGEAGGEMISFNNIVSMPAELPVLESGANTITYDNTVTDLKIVPRWWKI